MQFDFRQKHSSNHALLSMTQQSKDTTNKENIAVGVFVDFQKTFDTVNQNILLDKLDIMMLEDLQTTVFPPILATDSNMCQK